MIKSLHLICQEEQDLEQLCKDATEQYCSLIGLWKSELKRNRELSFFKHSANGAAARKCFEELKIALLQAFKCSVKVLTSRSFEFFELH